MLGCTLRWRPYHRCLLPLSRDIFTAPDAKLRQEEALRPLGKLAAEAAAAYYLRQVGGAGCAARGCGRHGSHDSTCKNLFLTPCGRGMPHIVGRLWFVLRLTP